jgi:hypothetical protein
LTMIKKGLIRDVLKTLYYGHILIRFLVIRPQDPALRTNPCQLLW